MIINRIYETQNLLSLQLVSLLVELRIYQHPYTDKDADKSLARPTSRCILFDGQNISFDASLVIYINSTNIHPIMIINRIYETQILLSLQLVSFLVGLRTYQHPSICHSVWVTVRYAHRITSTKCLIDTVISPDDRHIVGRNMQRREINILRKTVHQVGFIYNIIQGCTVNRT